MFLQEDDKQILEDIRNELNSEKPLKYIDYSLKNDFGYSYKNQYQLTFFSKHLCTSLSNLGMIPNKSLKLVFPSIPENLYSHFIRGYFDGDGSITQKIKNDKNRQITVTITSTESFCNSLCEICYEKIGIKAKVYDSSCHNGITKVFVLNGRNIAKTFLDWIYKDADLFLERKYKRYLQYYNLLN